jgi:hypothetical protein
MRVWFEFDRKLFIKNSFYIVLFGFSRRKYFLKSESLIISSKQHKLSGPFYCTRIVVLDFVLAFDTGPRLRVVKRGRKKAEGLRSGSELRKADDGREDRSPA